MSRPIFVHRQIVHDQVMKRNDLSWVEALYVKALVQHMLIRDRIPHVFEDEIFLSISDHTLRAAYCPTGWPFAAPAMRWFIADLRRVKVETTTNAINPVIFDQADLTIHPKLHLGKAQRGEAQFTAEDLKEHARLAQAAHRLQRLIPDPNSDIFNTDFL